jgi:DNA-binding NarL/FixJ family response regulator
LIAAMPSAMISRIAGLPIRVLLVDDSPNFLRSAARFLSADPMIEVVGHALSGHAALEQVAALRPDLVLMDMTLPEANGLEVTRRIMAQQDAPRVVMLTLHDNDEYRTAAKEAGASGYVPKGQMGEALFSLIHNLFDATDACVPA